MELLSLYLPTSPYTSNRKLQTRLSRCISLHLPTSPYTSLHLQAHASLEEDEELDEEALLDFAPQLGAHDTLALTLALTLPTPGPNTSPNTTDTLALTVALADTLALAVALTLARTLPRP